MDTLQQTIPPSGRLPPVRLIAWVKGILDPPNQPETMSEAARRRQSEREAAATELARLRTTAAEELPALASAERKALAHLERLTQGYQQAVRVYDEARVAHSHRAHDLAYAQTLQERRIEAAAEPVIAEFATGLTDLHLASLSHVVVEEERNEKWDQQAAKMVAEIWSNQPAVLARIDAILVAFRRAVAMTNDPDQSSIRERLAALIEDLPDPDTLSKIHTPGASEPSRRWPSYEESRAETLGMDLEDLKAIRSGGRRAEDRPARRSLLSRLTR